MSFISSKRIDNSRKSRFEIAPAISSYKSALGDMEFK